MAVPFLAVFLADHPRPTRWQGSGGDRHLKFYEPRDNLAAWKLVTYRRFCPEFNWVPILEKPTAKG